jgi:hypothetical protein
MLIDGLFDMYPVRSISEDCTFPLRKLLIWLRRPNRVDMPIYVFTSLLPSK